MPRSPKNRPNPPLVTWSLPTGQAVGHRGQGGILRSLQEVSSAACFHLPVLPLQCLAMSTKLTTSRRRQRR
jgi:hypothetical protein